MSVAGTTDSPLEIFAGLVTDMAPSDLPPGVSPDCQDVAFISGSAKTRPGLLSMFSAISGNPQVNYLKSYITQTGLLRLLALDAAGSLWKESPQGSLSLIASTIVPNSYGKSASLFTREYLAFGDGKYGIDIPRQFDDTNFDRVSQVGPGAAPSVADENAPFTIAAAGVPGAQMMAAANVQSASEVGNLCTLQIGGLGFLTGATFSAKAGDQITIAGVTPSGYNGIFTLAADAGFLPGQNQNFNIQYFNTNLGLASAGAGGTAQFAYAVIIFTTNQTSGQNIPTNSQATISGVTNTAYNGTFRVAHSGFFTGSSDLNEIIVNFNQFSVTSSGSGSASIAGNISAGKHQVSVAFVTRQGYITPPAPPQTWIAGGNKRVVVANIPTGPPNIVSRILLFTLAGQTSFFYAKSITGIPSSNFIIQDNATTTVTVDFSDVGLAAQINGDYLFRLRELGECSGVIEYASRLFWWGERAKLGDNKEGTVLNFSFDGGFTNTAPQSFPLGWTQVGTGDTGGRRGTGGDAYSGNSYVILGDGVTAVRGQITQSAFQDSNSVPILATGTAYSVRVRLLQLGITQGNFVAEIFSASAGSLGTFTVALPGSVTGAYKEFTGSLMASQTTIPSDALFRIYTSGTVNNGGQLDIDNVEVYPTNQPNNSSLVRASQVELPENYDGITGFLQVNENDGYAVRSAFILRENLYFVKEHGIYVTQDDGVNEPSGWKITEVSRQVGTPSVNGVAVGEDWAVIAHQSGLYITSGGEPAKISQEIQPTWDRINWNFGFKIWVQVDVQNRRIYVGVPLDTATTPNTILMLDYRGIERPDEIATAGPIHTSYSGKLLVLEKSRKWCPWTISANSGAIVLRFDGTKKLFMGNGAGNGKIYQLTDGQFTDDGAFIPGYYTTYFHFSHDLEQMFQVGSHYKLFTYLAMFIEGSAQVIVSSVLPGSIAAPIASIGLANPAIRDVEFPINVTAVRAAFKIATSNPGDWFRLARFVVNAIKHPASPVRGWN